MADQKDIDEAHRLLLTLERIDQAMQLVIAGVLAPELVPFVVALPPDTAAALGLLVPTGGISALLALPRVAPHPVHEVEKIMARLL